MQQETTIINDCYSLTLHAFIQCIVDGNLSVLGSGTEEELKAAWQNIYTEYASLRAESQTNEILELQKEIFVLDHKIKVTTLCVDVLWDFYSRELANELKKIGFQLKLDWSDKPGYYEELSTVISRSKTWVSQIANKNKELSRLVDKMKGKGFTRKDFVTINNSLAKYMKFRIDSKVISVAEWCDMISDYEAYVEDNAKESNKQ